MKLVLGVYDFPPHDYHYQWIDNDWTFTDINPRFQGILKMDARKIPNKDVEAIYASHVLEHIKESEVLDTLTHWHDVLEEGGWVHINVPDIEWGLDALMKFNIGEDTGSDYFTSREKIMTIFNGGMESEADTHKSWFNEYKLLELMHQAGFRDITVDRVFEAHDMGCLIARGIK
jgi:predicted SAM-dependent methyltransferase